MKEIGVGSIVRILSKNSEMQLPKKTGYRVLAAIAVSLIMIPCALVVGYISYVMTEALIEADNPGGGMLFEMQILSAFSMIFGILVIFSVLFFSSDREHFVTLPIPSHHLMFGKFIYAFIAESIMEFLILIAVFIGYIAAVAKNLSLAKAFHPVTLISSLSGIILIPLVPMIYCAIFSVLLMAALSKVKSVKVFYRTSTLFLLIFAALFIFSLRGMGEINMENYVDSLGSGDNLFLETLNIIFFTVPWLSNAVCQGNILYFLLFLAGNAALLAILFFLGKAFYQKGLYTAASLGTSKKQRVREKDVVMASHFKASLQKELRVILRTKAFSANTAFINLIWPVGAFMLFHFTKDKGALKAFIRMYDMGKDRADMILLMVIVSIAFIATALNSVASTSFTREGQHISLIKFIPVPYRTQLLAKAAVSFIFTYPALLATNIIICIYVHVPFGTAVLFAVLMLLAHIISIIVGMTMDSSSPYIEWDDEYSALRGNLNVFFNMAVMMMLSVAVILLGLFIYELLKLPATIFYIVLSVILAGAAVRMIIVWPSIIIENMKKL